MASWRQLTVDDIESLLRIADQIHPQLPESGSVYTERLKLFPEGCLALVEGDELCGYAISHPIQHRQPPALDSLIGEVALESDQYYIHDLAILPKMRGRGFAEECINKIFAIAKRYPSTCLISVYGTAPFWCRFGFAAEPVDEVLSKKLLEYGADATFLSRQNDGNAVRQQETT